MDYSDRILQLASSKKRIVVNGLYSKDTMFIIDFYNIYCSMISFCKYKTFSLETYLICMDRILRLVKNRKTVIVSKNIFEVEPGVIKGLLLFYPNVSYFVVEDACEIKGLNRERDDYFCIAYQAASKQKTVIISNDKFSNFETLIKEVKPFSVVKLGFPGACVSFTNRMIEETGKDLLPENVVRSSFSFYNS